MRHDDATKELPPETMMRGVVLALGTALAFGICGAAHAQDPQHIRIDAPANAPVNAPVNTPAAPRPDSAMTASTAQPLRDPDAEVPYLPPRRVIRPPLYGDPGLPLNPGGVPYDDLFASPYPFDIPDSFLRPADPDFD